MNSNGNPYDIMDLDYFCREDERLSASELHLRDRQIFLELAGLNAEESSPADERLLEHWLTRRRQTSEPASLLPGSLARETFALLRFILLTVGLLLGSGAGLAFLSYSGTTPVNVLHFLVVFVFSQLLLAMILLVRFGLANFGSGPLTRSLLLSLIGGLAGRLAGFLARQARQRTGADTRQDLAARRGTIQAEAARLAPLFRWPLFRLLQFAGAAFNLGLLAATLFKVLVSDLAFGWQSTLQFSAQSLHGFVRWLALPWSWLLAEGTGYPTLAEIEGSRIILKDGIANLQTPDLISWWPFLLLAVLVYGLALRLALAFWAGWRQRAEADRSTGHPAARQILRRMNTPVVSSQAAPEQVSQPAPTAGSHVQSPALCQQTILPQILVLVPDEMFEPCPLDELAALLGEQGYSPYQFCRFMVDYQGDRQLLAELQQALPEELAGVAILMESWMVPLTDFMEFLKELRAVIGERQLLILLVGKPDATPLTQVADKQQLKIWQEKMASLGDGRLSTRPLLAE